MGEQRVRVEAVPWALVIILTIFVAAFGLIWDLLIPASLACAYDMGTVEWVMEVTLMPFFGVMVLAALTRIKSLREKMSMTKITYLYTAFMVTSYFVCPGGHPIYTLGRVAYDRVKYPIESLVFPSFMAPSTEIVQQMVSGGVPVPWLEWLPTIIFWWVEVVLFSFFFVCVANIFRRQWLDIEQVPFPVTVATFQIADNIVIGGLGERKGRYKMFMIGMILGFAIQTLIGLASLLPWFPDPFGWRVNTCPSGFGYISADSPLGAIAGFSGARKAPVSYFIGYLVPLSILFSTWFWYLIFLILAQVAYMMGYYTGIMERAGCGRAGCRPGPLFSPPIETAVAANVGGGIMLTIMLLYLNRSYILETLRAALGKLPTARVKEMEKNEALSYRLNYLAVIVSFLLMIGLLLASGMSFLSSILTPVSAFLFWFSTLRVYGTTAIQTGTSARGWAIPRLIYGEWGEGGPVPLTTDFALTNYFMKSPGGDMPSMGWSGGMLSCFAGYRMAIDTGASNKNVFRVAVCTIIIAPVIATIAFLFMTYTFGVTKLPMGSFITYTAMDQYVIRPSSAGPGEGDWIPHALFGMVMVGFLSIMHARFIWFPLEPIGFIIGWGDAGPGMGYWSSFAVAWVVKFITLKVGGSKAYEEYGVPIAVGGVAGCMLSIFIGGALHVLRFFVPF